MRTSFLLLVLVFPHLSGAQDAVPVGCDRPCTQNYHCPSGSRPNIFYCVSTTNTCRLLKFAGERCGGPCETCDSFETACINNVCLASQCGWCRTSAECQPGLACIKPGWTQACMKVVGRGEACSSSPRVHSGLRCTGCTDGLFCNRGFCEPLRKCGFSCTRSEDCVDGTECLDAPIPGGLKRCSKTSGENGTCGDGCSICESEGDLECRDNTCLPRRKGQCFEDCGPDSDYRECAEGLFCKYWSCRKRTLPGKVCNPDQCTSCTQYERCTTVWGYAYPICASDEDRWATCGGDCSWGYCVGRGLSCLGNVCVTNRNGNIGDVCADSETCSGCQRGLSCVTGICMPSGTCTWGFQSLCNAEFPCESGFTCHEGLCWRRTKALNAYCGYCEYCGPDAECREYFCRPKPIDPLNPPPTPLPSPGS